MAGCQCLKLKQSAARKTHQPHCKHWSLHQAFHLQLKVQTIPTAMYYTAAIKNSFICAENKIKHSRQRLHGRLGKSTALFNSIWIRAALVVEAQVHQSRNP